MQEKQLQLNGQGNFIAGRMVVYLASVIVACPLELNWWSYLSCGGASLVIRRDLQWT